MPVQHILKYFILSFIEILKVTELQFFSCAVAKNPKTSIHSTINFLSHIIGVWSCQQVRPSYCCFQANTVWSRFIFPLPNLCAKWSTDLPTSPEAHFRHQKHVLSPSPPEKPPHAAETPGPCQVWHPHPATGWSLGWAQPCSGVKGKWDRIYFSVSPPHGLGFGIGLAGSLALGTLPAGCSLAWPTAPTAPVPHLKNQIT